MLTGEKDGIVTAVEERCVRYGRLEAVAMCGRGGGILTKRGTENEGGCLQLEEGRFRNLRI